MGFRCCNFHQSISKKRENEKVDPTLLWIWASNCPPPFSFHHVSAWPRFIRIIAPTMEWTGRNVYINTITSIYLYVKKIHICRYLSIYLFYILNKNQYSNVYLFIIKKTHIITLKDVIIIGKKKLPIYTHTIPVCKNLYTWSSLHDNW